MARLNISVLWIAGLVILINQFSIQQENSGKGSEKPMIHNLYVACVGNLCEFSPCLNGGACYPVTLSDGTQHFVCACGYGFGGEVCGDTAPRIALDYGPTFVEQNTNVTLPKCHVTGFPTPEVEWSKIGGSLPAQSVDKNGELKLFSVTKQDAGQYKCKATNIVGIDDAKTSVEVIEFVKPPEVLNTTKDAQETVQCRAATESIFHSVSWSKSNGELPAGRAVTLQDGSLKLTNIQTEDAGKYVCTVSVGNSKFVAEMQLNVLSIP